MWPYLVILLTIAVLYFVFRGSHQTPLTEPQTAPGYTVGSPGVGRVAPAFALASTSGHSIALSSFRRKTVLLYFQEGLTCEPCWTQLKDLQSAMARLHAAGVDDVISITTDPIGLLKQKVADEGIAIPILSDPSLSVSRAYHANDYGMMGSSRDGHSFLLIGPRGRIRWRADYGGPPNYTMYVPVSTLLADIKSEENKR